MTRDDDELADAAASAWRGRIEGIARSAASTAEWQPFAALALYEAACVLTQLTSDDVWLALKAHGIPMPGEHRGMGAVMVKGAKIGIVRNTGRTYITDVPATKRNQGRPQTLYASRIFGRPKPQWPERPAAPAPAAVPKAPTKEPTCPRDVRGKPCGQILRTTRDGLGGYRVGRCPVHSWVAYR